ncbi:hypothetical protein GN956_G25628 [Arapaima gigas]
MSHATQVPRQKNFLHYDLVSVPGLQTHSHQCRSSDHFPRFLDTRPLTGEVSPAQPAWGQWGQKDDFGYSVTLACHAGFCGPP